ncbi:ABC-type taurine transport system, periplasmic component [Slackia heliotrinireducens]|uniref:ABC-type nitrate/sulfonate/bicarbonate transport system, periplasmic component n=1 Tax=Slackia heliotrinireducens (strain ATCC 29202 / DSM 20476 / NCTC 11029 / RHS 1) TaxID=471855 RepID=C7N654_SLAHD|nr:ABC transporter substrate-binding protein [Slackia heliotrinireducens]ACV22389.1 ABC-type nitrate/sulfonate/bicarbonate transport system, periplasmic component [Slackia heliotrinireducens DSM 20476]VEH00691.1 ABC-type taurine transport system, periplasmic component [Slackia heliotrinireducens]
MSINPASLAGLSRRSFMKVAGAASVIAAAGLSVGCAQQGGDGAPANTDGLTEISFVLDYTPNTNHTGVYVAIANGYYEEEGLAVTIVMPPEDGADALIGSGGAQFGVTYQDTMANYLASETPMPYTAVAAVVQHNTSGIMSRAEDNITSPKKMEGHTYATWNLDVEQATIRDVVEADGGDFSKVEMVPYAVDDDVAGLRTKAFDTVWVYEGWAVQNAKIQDFEYNYFPFIEFDSALDFYTPVIAVNDEFMAANPDVVKAFLRATAKGYEFAVSDPQAAADILVEAVPELDPELVAESQEYLAGQYISDAERWGEFDADRWAAYYQWLNDEKLVATELAVDAGYTNDYLA